ncbi:PilZ domain-containing protein [bacterium]|nr:PilZ domain-containing protein [bacterium]
MNYFGTSRVSFWDFFAVSVIILLFLIVIVAAFREWRVQKRARHLVIHRYGKGGGSRGGRLTRRKTPRLPIRIPIRASELGTPITVEGEVLDISVGGLRFLLFDPPDPVDPGKVYSIESNSPPLDTIGHQRMKVVRSELGPNESTVIVRGQWASLSNDKATQLNREIRKRLLYGR